MHFHWKLIVIARWTLFGQTMNYSVTNLLPLIESTFGNSVHYIFVSLLFLEHESDFAPL